MPRTLKKPRVYIHGPGALTYMLMFLERGYVGTEDYSKAGLVVYTGGADVNPELYGQKNAIVNGRPISIFSDIRDEQDIVMYGYAEKKDVFQVGICRGAQFLNVMNGGELWQHVDGHAIHSGHDLLDTRTGEIVRVTSTHHQMMRPPEHAEILAVAVEAKNKYAENEYWSRRAEGVTPQDPQYDDVEAVWFQNTKCLCFQPHPEFHTGPCRDYFFELLEEKLCAVS